MGFDFHQCGYIFDAYVGKGKHFLGMALWCFDQKAQATVFVKTLSWLEPADNL